LNTLTEQDRIWLESEYGRSFLQAEREHTDRAISQLAGPRVLKIGNTIHAERLYDLDFPQLVTTQSRPGEEALIGEVRVCADPAFLPFEAESFSSVILPHAIEGNELPHQVLREAHRVLQANGDLLLSGFNPFSLLGLQRLVGSKASYLGQYYSLKRVRDWLQLLGFEITGSAMYQYAPLCKTNRMRKAVKFINSSGDRWLPMAGGSYMISARKRELGMRLIGPVNFSSQKRRPKMVTASASSILKPCASRKKAESKG